MIFEASPLDLFIPIFHYKIIINLVKIFILDND